MMRWLMTAIAMLVAGPATADSWAPATRTTYESPDRQTRLTVIPRELESNLAYFEDKVAEKDAAGQRPGGEPRARGVLERRARGKWVTVWQAPLVNEVAPVSALVPNGGGHVVTFDNWHSTGFGDHVVVIYRGDGSVVRSYKLTDILPEDYVRALPTSVSSMHWSGEHALSKDGRQVVLKVVVPNGQGSIGDPRGYLDVTIVLATGAVTPLSGPTWEKAQAATAPLAARSKSEEARWRMEALMPLAAPEGTKAQDWARYLYQARARLAPPERDLWSFEEVVLPAATSSDATEHAVRIREMLTEWEDAGDFAFASPDAPADLARLLVTSATATRPGRLKGYRLFVALPEAQVGPVRAALAPTGATVIVFDPAVPIPQRAERLRELGVDPGDLPAAAVRAALDAKRFEAEAMMLEAKAAPGPLANGMTEAEFADRMEEMADQLEVEADKATARRKAAGEAAATPR